MQFCPFSDFIVIILNFVFVSYLHWNGLLVKAGRPFLCTFLQEYTNEEYDYDSA